MNPTVIINI